MLSLLSPGTDQQQELLHRHLLARINQNRPRDAGTQPCMGLEPAYSLALSVPCMPSQGSAVSRDVGAMAQKEGAVSGWQMGPAGHWPGLCNFLQPRSQAPHV